jgi:hypothetical protein
MLLGSHAVAGHGIPLVGGSGGQGKGWLAGLLAGRKASCWRGDAVRIAGMSNENESMDLGLDGLSESSGPNRRAWQRCATRHPQARRNKCPAPAATADDSVSW